jgi:hypothetical protein
MDSLQKVDSLLSYIIIASVVKRKKKDKWIVLFDYFSIGFPIILPHSVHEPS